jgi:hypothetical protein
VRAVRALLGLLLAAAVLGACGGDSPSPPESADSPPTAYVTKMRPIVSDVGRALRGASLSRAGRDFDRGVALLRARRRMARLTADPALLLAHDRLSRALGRGGTLLVAEPGSPYVAAARQAGTPLGPRGAVSLVAPALSGWAFETSEKLRAASVPVPEWLVREKSAADRLVRRASS